MNYKGFVITKVAAPGSDFDFTEDGRLKNRRPRKEDYSYEVHDPMEGDRFCVEHTLEEAKEAIRDVLTKMNMPNNSPEEWAKLEGNPYGESKETTT